MRRTSKWRRRSNKIHRISPCSEATGSFIMGGPRAATSAMTMPLLALIGLMAICLLFGFQLKEPLLDKS